MPCSRPGCENISAVECPICVPLGSYQQIGLFEFHSGKKFPVCSQTCLELVFAYENFFHIRNFDQYKFVRL